MNIRFLIRSADHHDLESLMRLAPQALLVNLPPDEDILTIKIARSLQAFSANPPPSAEYLFVLEDVASGEVVGTSLIIARYATPQRPHYFFEVRDTSRGQELTLGVRTGGLSAIGGLVLDRRYRGKPEKRGRQISLIRFVFMGMQPRRFEPTVLSELMAPVAPDGSNFFWDALGGRFTGMRYAEAFALTRQRSRDFIPRHYPAAPICLPAEGCGLQRNQDQVLESAKPEQRILEKVGFSYNRRVDPMDGALHYEAPLAEISIVKNGRFYRVSQTDRASCQQSALLGFMRGDRFFGGQYPVRVRGADAALPGEVMALLGLASGEEIYLSLLA
ncbi:MAG: arginine N-succinyltransferase [Desulfobacteraceae bacterium]|jgi:arginine N-succinyltransferase